MSESHASAPLTGLLQRLGRRGPRGPKVLVVTDAAAALPADFVDTYAEHLHVVGMPVTIGDRTYVEEFDDVGQQLSLGLAMGLPVSTSRVPPGQMLKVLDAAAQAGFDDAVIIALSSSLSGTVDSARWAAERAVLPTHVIDSLSAGLGQGFAVMAATELAQRRAPLQDILAAARTGDRSRIWLCVPSLDRLRKGGRISGTASFMGTLLNVKPLLGLTPDGRVVPLERVRSLPRAVERMVELAQGVVGPDPERVRVGVHHFGAPDLAADLAEKVRGWSSHEPVVTAAPPVLAAHTGAGLTALVVRNEPVS
ncbi:MAG: DegV family protein [Galactobacter sp.]|uniref:DegV family protein n=1 Tax=Galactobacter sp. TaxID=2676125 RepID=UPI0025C0A9BD|nr:DegV family protein [Galactobacter sp.]